MKIFDGGWVAHSTKLITSLTNARFTNFKEVLVMPSRALVPLSWDARNLERLYMDGQEEFDWRRTYSIHGFSSAFHFEGSSLNPEAIKVFQSMNVDYLLRKESNFARGVYAAVEDAVKSGLLPFDYAEKSSETAHHAIKKIIS